MATANRQNQPPEQPPRQSQWMSRFEPIVNLVAQASLILMLLTLAYVFFGILKGNLSNPHDVENVQTAANICAVCASVFALCMLFLHLEENEMVIYMGLLGAAFYFGLPFAVGMILQKAAVTAPADATRLINQRFITGGQVVLGAVILRFLYAFIGSLREVATRERKRANVGFAEKAKDPSQLKVGKPSIFSRCWQLPYCRESVRKACPAFLSHKTCWKFGRGCYCDEEMIAKIVRGETSLGATRRPSTSFVQSQIKDTTGGPRQSRKPPCGKCFIYLEHQNLKHRAISPFIVPGTILVMYLLKDVFGIVYGTVGGWLTTVINRLSFQAVSTPMQGPDPMSKQAEYFIAFIVGVFVLIYVTKFVEFCIYKWKI